MGWIRKEEEKKSVIATWRFLDFLLFAALTKGREISGDTL